MSASEAIFSIYGSGQMFPQNMETILNASSESTSASVPSAITSSVGA